MTVSPEKWKSYLKYKIQGFLKKEDIDFFNIVKFWFIALEGDQSIDFEFVYSSPLVSILVSNLLKFQDLKSKEIVNAIISILQTLSVLTSFDAPQTPFFSTPELLQAYGKLLLRENDTIVKLVLIIFAQLLYKDPELLSFLYSIKLNESLANNFLLSENDEISSVSIFLLCEIAQIDKNETKSILEFLFTIPLDISDISSAIAEKYSGEEENSKIKIPCGIKYLTFLRSLQFFSSDFLDSIISNNFCGLCIQLLPIVTKTILEIESFKFQEIKQIIQNINNGTQTIFLILSLLIGNENGLESFISSNLIALISQLELINSKQQKDIFAIIIDLFANLIMVSNANVNHQIVENEIIEKICFCALNSEYQNKMNAIKFIIALFQKSDKELCQIAINNNGIQSFFDNFDTFEKEMFAAAVQSLITYLSANPDKKELFSTFDIDKLANEIDQKDDDEMYNQGQILMSLIK